ncbi:MAG: 5-formyltetrahydrofolate cyclo-ligase [Alphaproteobacteria bacterium]|nr:5-formyltetrahydrofolate cyclo-ligase [Alphaproteobacteria bacterium]
MSETLSPKAALRKQALARRKAVSQEAREAFAGRLAIEGVKLARRAIVKNVSAYWAIGLEADPRLLMAALDYHQFSALLPVTQPQGEPLIFRRWREGQRLIEGPMGLMEPSRYLPEAVPQMLFVPLAAFDRRGFRIGYGAGHYDVTLAHLRARGPAPAIGIAFACQEIPRVPEEVHDQPLDFVLTENELIDCSLAWT